MDEEDIRVYNALIKEFGGIQSLVATRDFDPTRVAAEMEKEKRALHSSLTGEASNLMGNLLDEIILPAKESIGMKLIRKIGFKGESTASLAMELLKKAQQIQSSFRLDSGIIKEESKSKGFGVGAFEEEDEDIYDNDSKGSFNRTIDETEEESKKSVKPFYQFGDILSGFIKCSIKEEEKWFPSPEIPLDYVPSKIEPDEIETWKEGITTNRTFKILTAEERGKMLGESQSTQFEDSVKFAISSEIANLALSGFMPFESNKEKHSRYVQYLQYYAEQSLEYPSFPKEYSVIQIDHEKEEFYKAAHIYRPLSMVMAQRFKSSSEKESVLPSHGLRVISSEEIEKRKDKKVEEKAKTVYSKGEIRRTQYIWFPSPLLCKRFRIRVPMIAETSESVAVSAPSESKIVDVASIKKAADSEDMKEKLEASLQVDAEMDKGLPLERPPMSLFKSIFGDDDDEEKEEESESKQSKPVYTKPKPKATSKIEKKNPSAGNGKVQLDYGEEGIEVKPKRSRVIRPSAADFLD